MGPVEPSRVMSRPSPLFFPRAARPGPLRVPLVPSYGLNSCARESCPLLGASTHRCPHIPHSSERGLQGWSITLAMTTLRNRQRDARLWRFGAQSRSGGGGRRPLFSWHGCRNLRRNQPTSGTRWSGTGERGQPELSTLPVGPVAYRGRVESLTVSGGGLGGVACGFRPGGGRSGRSGWVRYSQKSVIARSSSVRRRRSRGSERPITLPGSPSMPSMNGADRPSRVNAPATCSGSPLAT